MTKRKFDILKKEEVFKKFIFRIEMVTLKHEKFDGTMSREITRLNFDRGHCVAVLVHDVAKDTVLLVQQFRYPALSAGQSGWQIELPAGIIDENETPREAAKREVQEEMGYTMDREPELINTVFMSPGGSSEMISIFYCPVTDSENVSEFGGVDSEDEDIRVLSPSLQEAVRLMTPTSDDNVDKIEDAKTVLALQWLLLQNVKK